MSRFHYCNVYEVGTLDISLRIEANPPIWEQAMFNELLSNINTSLEQVMLHSDSQYVHEGSLKFLCLNDNYFRISIAIVLDIAVVGRMASLIG